MIHIFIINRFAGNKELSQSVRKYLAQRMDLRYFVFNTMTGDHERGIVGRILRYFPDEKLRFYCCGGSGTVRNVLDVLAALDDLSNVELAVFPCGLTNDFLKTLGGAKPFQNLAGLIDGDVVSIDYIKTNHGAALNTVSIGFDSKIIELLAKYRVYGRFSKRIPYFLACFLGVIFGKTGELALTVNGRRIDDDYSEVIFGNGCTLGGGILFTDYANVRDGRLSYMIVHRAGIFRMLALLVRLIGKRPDRAGGVAELGMCMKAEITRENGQLLLVNYDGELVDCGELLEIRVVPRGLRFVVPKGTDIGVFAMYDA